jgi:hypothetical protein
METAPVFVHCCHCRCKICNGVEKKDADRPRLTKCQGCQRESGSAFVLNAIIESDRVSHLREEPEVILTPSESGAGQKIARCRDCKVAVWSNYCNAGPVLRFIRVGTLDQPDRITPDIHIYVASKQPWVILPQGPPAVEEFYKVDEFWPAHGLERLEALKPKIDAYHAASKCS